MHRINSRGMAQANKHVLRAALTYNLKKYMNFNSKNVQSGVTALQNGLKSFEKGIKRPFFNAVFTVWIRNGRYGKNSGDTSSFTFSPLATTYCEKTQSGKISGLEEKLCNGYRC
jgi:hypothetical protein